MRRTVARNAAPLELDFRVAGPLVGAQPATRARTMGSAFFTCPCMSIIDVKTCRTIPARSITKVTLSRMIPNLLRIP